MSLLRLMFGLLVTMTIVVTAITLLIGPMMVEGRGGSASAWQVYATPAGMILLCLLSYRWLRRRES